MIKLVHPWSFLLKFLRRQKMDSSKMTLDPNRNVYIYSHNSLGYLKCCRSRGILKSIWGTNMLLTPDDSVDIQIKTTLKELILYIIFFTALLISKICDSMFPLSCNLISATLGMTTFLSATNFQFQEILNKLFGPYRSICAVENYNDRSFC